MLRHKVLAWSCLWVCVLVWSLAPIRASAQMPEGKVDLAPSPAVLVIQLPANAELELVGEKTTQTGASRRFKTPPLAADREYDYPIKATWKENGQPRTVERVLKVRA